MRLPFLVFTLIGGLLAGFVIDGFEETLEAIAIVAVFIPIIMDMGVATALVAYFWNGIPQLGLAVGLAITFTTTVASALGFVVPFMLVKLNMDQAAGTDPIITSIKDITGLLVYFYLVTFFLGHLL